MPPTGPARRRPSGKPPRGRRSKKCDSCMFSWDRASLRYLTARTGNTYILPQDAPCRPIRGRRARLQLRLAPRSHRLRRLLAEDPLDVAFDERRLLQVGQRPPEGRGGARLIAHLVEGYRHVEQQLGVVVARRSAAAEVGCRLGPAGVAIGGLAGQVLRLLRVGVGVGQLAGEPQRLPEIGGRGGGEELF